MTYLYDYLPVQFATSLYYIHLIVHVCGLRFIVCFNFRFVSSSSTRFSRQKPLHTYVPSHCSSDEDCIPLEYQNVSIPSSLISCNTSSGLCKCQKCFVRSKDVCELNRNACNTFMVDTCECSDDRKSQKTALLLSGFLSAIGAANFYIGQNLLG